VRALRIATLALVLVGGFTYVVPRTAYAQEQEDIKEGDELFEAGGEKNLKKAAKKYDRAIKKGPSLVPPGVYGKRAAIYFLLKDYDGGLRFIDNIALKYHPNAPEILEQKALILWQLGRKGDAIDIADKVADSKEDSFQVQTLRGEYYYSRDPAKAAAAFEAYLKYRPAGLAGGDAMPRLKLGIAYLTIERWEDAERQFETVTKQFRKNPKWVLNANNGLCAAYTKTGKFDRAITLCERIIENPKHIDRRGSAWFNLGQAYLQKKQPRKARQAGLEFIRVQRGKAKGYVLVGDAYFNERDYDNALRYYLEAEQRAGAGGNTALLLKLGKAYRSLDKPEEALPRLESALANSPGDVDIAQEIGEVYLHPKVAQDTKALSAVDKLLDGNPDNAQLRYIAARALYNQGKLAQAKLRYLEAHKLNRKSIKYRDGLVDTINRQASAAHAKGDLRTALANLEDAHQYYKGSALTNRNLAVLSLESNRCDEAHQYLKVLRKSRQNRVVADRLTARAYMCQKKPNRAKAAEFYAAADKGTGGRRGNQLLRAEIYAEWAPLLMSKDIDDAIEKLEFAAQVAGTDPLRADAINRNLAVALYTRGWKYMDSGKEAKAVSDFERATRNQGVLMGAEPMAFDFSLALAYLDVGKTQEASELFAKLAKTGKQEKYLESPYDKVGASFFGAYAEYRTNNLKSRRKAAAEFAKLQKGAKGKFGVRVKELLASSWEWVALSEYRGGNSGAAGKALTAASKLTSDKRAGAVIEHNREVLKMGSKGDPKVFEKLGANPPEALINLGIAYDRAGEPRKAYDAWVKAHEKGARAPDLQKWIDAKKRIFGY